MEKTQSKSAVKAWTLQLIVGWIVICAFCGGVWLSVPPPASWPHFAGFWFWIMFPILGFGHFRETIKFINVSLTTVPVSVQEFPNGVDAEFVCDFVNLPPSGLLLVELTKARLTDLDFEFFGADRTEIQKTIRRKTQKGVMGGVAPIYFVFDFNQLPPWATGVRVRVSPVNPVPSNCTWIRGRIYLRAKKLETATAPLAAAQK